MKVQKVLRKIFKKMSGALSMQRKVKKEIGQEKSEKTERKVKEKVKGRENEEKDKFLQPDINIGLVGHIDHGKTTLLWRLSGKWADVHSEELKRGITIKLGYANAYIRECKNKNCKKLTYSDKCPRCNSETKILRHVSFVDAPGHKMLMASMLGGAAIIDAALLVIAANETFPQPQTKEHFLALNAKKVKNIILIQNKIDLVSKEQAYEQYKQIVEFFRNQGILNISIIPCSAIQDVNIDLIYKEILRLPKPQRNIDVKPIFFVVRSFDVNLPGADIKELKGGVVGGALKQGKLKVGNEIVIKPGLTITKEVQHKKITEYRELTAKIISLRSTDVNLQEALPYGNLAVQTSLDPYITKSDKLAGCLIGLKDSLPPVTNKIKFNVRLFEKLVGAEKEEKIEEIKMDEFLLLSINTTLTLAKVTSISTNISNIKNKKNKVYEGKDERKEVEKEVKEIGVELFTPIVSLPDSTIGIARNYKGQWRLIGYGELIL